MLSVWYSFYWEESFEGTHLVCTWNFLVSLHQMCIQRRQSRIFRQAYSLNTWRQGAPMYVVSWHDYLKSSHGKAHWIFTLHGQVTKLKVPPISICIYCWKSNTNKEEVDKHIICHIRGGGNNLVVNIMKRHLHSSIIYYEKSITRSLALRKHALKVDNAIKQIHQESI